MTKITITRNNGWFGKMRKAKIMADKIEVGSVKSGETVTVEIPGQANNLYAKMDWGRSKPYSTNTIKEEQVIYMNCWFTLNPLRNLGIMSIPIAYNDKPR